MNLPKSPTAIRFFFICLLISFSGCAFAQAGKDGAKVINAPGSYINDYTVLIANANSGATAIQVANYTLNVGFSSPLNTGDLILLIQVQGATINPVDNSTYGNIASYQNCGNYEFAEVASVFGPNIINLTCPISKNYIASEKVVVVRVPRFLTLTVNGGASITCPPWNGVSGGIIAAEVLGTTTINGGATIDATGKGFRGGALLYNNSGYGIGNYRWPTNDFGAEKGEGIAGSVIDYDNLGGRYCKGAPANGGGGGNAHNTGGGGGANSGDITSYTGKGNPDISNGSWATAWNLEAAGFSASTSSGGGKGGYSFSSTDLNALAVGPTNPSWGGDTRTEQGGRGGYPLDYSTGKIFMGGGGGAGDENDSRGGAGGAGGGIIFLYTNAPISGSGQIISNGSNGASTTTTNGTDGAGGGGGGGTILINSSGAISGITINANGGQGGSQSVFVFTSEAEGPGGGGGGGYIAISNGSITRNANGGTNGVTNSVSLSEFPPNGATKGGTGINNATLNTFRINTQPVNICSSSSVTLVFTTQGTPPPGVTYGWYNQSSGGTAIGTGTSFTTPVLTASQTYYVGSCPGFSRIPIQVNVSSNLSASFTSNTVCAGNPTVFSGSGSPGVTSWNWNFGDGVGASSQQNPVYTYAGGGTYNVTLSVSDGICTTSISQSVTINNTPVANFTSTALPGGCGPLTVNFTNNSSNASSYSWNFGDGTPLNTQVSPSHTYAAGGSYSVVLTATGSGCTRTHSINISAGSAPTASFVSTNNICQNDTVHFTNLSLTNGSPITSLSWNFGDGSPTSSAVNPYHIYSGTGSFTVRLTANTSSCTDDTTINIVISPAPIVNFSTTQVSGCQPMNVVFSNSTTGNPSYTWSFGDGSPVSNQSAPTHNYLLPGQYSVSLIATQGSCADTLLKNNYITVLSKPFSSFSAAAVCNGDSIRFINLSNGNGNNITSYSWTFGDGSFGNSTSPAHLYSASGNYNVLLTANTATCSDDTTISISVIPDPVVSFSSNTTQACDSATVQFINSSTGANTYNWNFGDGNASTSASPVHSYLSPGSYTVMLTATGNGGCNATRASMNMIQIHSSPVVSFTSSVFSLCSNECTTFIPQAGSGIISWHWTFPGGSPATSTSQTPGNICYPSPGNFDVTLNASTAFCSSIQTIPSIIHVANCSSFPKANFISSDTLICGNSCIDFVDMSTNAINWQWNFPGATPSNSVSENPSGICYSGPGSYSVTLIAGNTLGHDTIVYTNFIQVAANPVMPNISLFGDTLQSTPAAHYQWYLNNIPLSGAISQNFIAQITGEYSVSTTDANGCIASSSQEYVSIVGVENPERNLLFYVYPNPVNNELIVVFQSSRITRVKLTLYSIPGSVVFSDFLTVAAQEQRLRMNLKDIVPGMYFIQIESDEQRWIRPIIKL